MKDGFEVITTEKFLSELVNSMSARWLGRTYRRMAEGIVERKSQTCYNNTRIDYYAKKQLAVISLYGTEILSVDYKKPMAYDAVKVLSDYPSNLTLSRMNFVLRALNGYISSSVDNARLVLYTYSKQVYSSADRVAAPVVTGKSLMHMVSKEVNSARVIDDVPLTSMFSPNQINKLTPKVKQYVLHNNSEGGGMALISAYKSSAFVQGTWTSKLYLRTTDAETTAFTRASMICNK